LRVLLASSSGDLDEEENWLRFQADADWGGNLPAWMMESNEIDLAFSVTLSFAMVGYV
jgi:hypothetical protein